MGYETDFTITTKENKNLEEVFKKLSVSTDYTTEWFELANNEITISAKWYNFDSDITYISKLLSDTVIVVLGDGEENGDVWCKYYKKWSI
jgi:hypothetical protein